MVSSGQQTLQEMREEKTGGLCWVKPLNARTREFSEEPGVHIPLKLARLQLPNPSVSGGSPVGIIILGTRADMGLKGGMG